MFDHLYTDQVHRALTLAKQAAQARSHATVSPIHLTLGLLQEQRESSGCLFQQLQVEPERLITYISALASAGHVSSVDGGPTVEQIMTGAHSEAIKMGDPFIACQHVVLALLNAPLSADLREVLDDFGLTYESVLTAHVALMTKPARIRFRHFVEADGSQLLRLFEGILVNNCVQASEVRGVITMLSHGDALQIINTVVRNILDVVRTPDTFTMTQPPKQPRD